MSLNVEPSDETNYADICESHIRGCCAHLGAEEHRLLHYQLPYLWQVGLFHTIYLIDRLFLIFVLNQICIIFRIKVWGVLSGTCNRFVENRVVEIRKNRGTRFCGL